MYLVRRWDNVTLERTTGEELAKMVAQDMSAERKTQVDVVESWDDRPERKVTSYFNGSEC
jgi:hypothetical protein